MARDLIYLDYNATAVPRPEVVEAVTAVLSEVGNPSSVHAAGRRAAAVLAEARDKVAALVGVPSPAVTFTSGATEANNSAILGTPAARLLISAVEHDSVWAPAERSGKTWRTIGVDGNGLLDLDALDRALGESDEPTLVSVMAVNNETGVIQPVSEIGRIAQEHGALFHCDAVQAAGKFDLMTVAAHAHLISLSAHKIGGPAGVGALVAPGERARVSLISGGGQESGSRAGTENLAGIAGFGRAAELALKDMPAMARLVELRDAMESELRGIAPKIVIAGAHAPRVANTSCIAMPGMPAETQVMAFDLAGIAVSAGSACSSGKIRRSHVLSAMGFDDETARSAIRVSLGWNTEDREIGRFIAAWRDIHARSEAARNMEASA